MLITRNESYANTNRCCAVLGCVLESPPPERDGRSVRLIIAGLRSRDNKQSPLLAPQPTHSHHRSLSCPNDFAI
eukprot:750429-Hanusia_phi.AAC.3